MQNNLRGEGSWIKSKKPTEKSTEEILSEFTKVQFVFAQVYLIQEVNLLEFRNSQR
jgi:hypothetical protein